MGFRRSSQDPQVPDYLSGEALLSASKDCLSFAIIETDRLKLEKILNDLKELNDDNVCDSIDEFFGYLVFNKNDEEFELALFIKEDSSSNWDDVIFIYVEKEGLSYSGGGFVISSSPLLITLEIGHTWGYLRDKSGIKDVEICSPEIDLYDWKAAEDWIGLPYIRNPD